VFYIDPEEYLFDSFFPGHPCGHPLTYFFFTDFLFHELLLCLDDACKDQAGFNGVCITDFAVSLILIRFYFCGIVTVFIDTDTFAVIHDDRIFNKIFEGYVFDLAELFEFIV
jgi:hypothetical protein